MILLEPPRTPWDLKWSMFSIPVRAHPLFWLSTLLLAYRGGDDQRANIDHTPFKYVVAVCVCVFVSILVHEFGHAFAHRYYGDRRPHVVLWVLGGLCIGSGDLKRWPR